MLDIRANDLRRLVPATATAKANGEVSFASRVQYGVPVDPFPAVPATRRSHAKSALGGAPGAAILTNVDLVLAGFAAAWIAWGLVRIVVGSP